jgi:hypothetical protein
MISGVRLQEVTVVNKFVKFTLFVLGNCVLSAAAAFAATTYTITLQSPLTCVINCSAFPGQMWSILPARDTLTIGSGTFAATGADIFMSFATPPTSTFGNLFTGVPTGNNDQFGMSWNNNSDATLALVGPLPATQGQFEPIQVTQLNPTTGALSYEFEGMYTLTSQAVSTPEPGSAGLLLIGLAALVGAGTLRKKLIA